MLWFKLDHTNFNLNILNSFISVIYAQIQKPVKDFTKKENSIFWPKSSEYS